MSGAFLVPWLPDVELGRSIAVWAYFCKAFTASDDDGEGEVVAHLLRIAAVLSNYQDATITVVTPAVTLAPVGAMDNLIFVSPCETNNCPRTSSARFAKTHVSTLVTCVDPELRREKGDHSTAWRRECQVDSMFVSDLFSAVKIEPDAKCQVMKDGHLSSAVFGSVGRDVVSRIRQGTSACIVSCGESTPSGFSLFSSAAGSDVGLVWRCVDEILKGQEALRQQLATIRGDRLTAVKFGTVKLGVVWLRGMEPHDLLAVNNLQKQKDLPVLRIVSRRTGGKNRVGVSASGSAFIEGLSMSPIDSVVHAKALVDGATSRAMQLLYGNALNPMSFVASNHFLFLFEVVDPITVEGTVNRSRTFSVCRLTHSVQSHFSSCSKDAQNISKQNNETLSCLSQCISMISTATSKGHGIPPGIPFRNSALTRILAPALCGESDCLLQVVGKLGSIPKINFWILEFLKAFKGLKTLRRIDFRDGEEIADE